MRTLLWAAMTVLLGGAIGFCIFAYKSGLAFNSVLPQAPIVEISTQPNILLNIPQYPHDRLTLEGFAIGDPETRFTSTEIANKSGSGDIPTFGNSFNIKDGKVRILTIDDRQILDKIGLKSREDMINRFGPPPITDSGYYGYPSLGLGFGWYLETMDHPPYSSTYILIDVAVSLQH